MSRVFPGLGPDTLVPQPRPDVYSSLQLSAEEGFVLSRIDGRLNVAEICLLVPFEPTVTATLMAGLARVGAITVPGLAATPIAPRPLQPEPEPQPQPQPQPVREPNGESAAPVALAAGTDISVDQARRIDGFFESLSTRDAFALLELTRDADHKTVKRAYFKLSKEFHPDRYFGKELGPYAERLSRIFQSIKAAFELLSDDDRRAAYLESMRDE